MTDRTPVVTPLTVANPIDLSTPWGHLRDTVTWFEAAGQLDRNMDPSVDQSQFYLGMQCEELAEKLGAVLGEEHPDAVALGNLGNEFKRRQFTQEMTAALSSEEKRARMLDGDMDLLWVSLGAGVAVGADPVGAYEAVLHANWSKFSDGTVVKDPVTGKVLKPMGWREPDMSEFLNNVEH